MKLRRGAVTVTVAAGITLFGVAAYLSDPPAQLAPAQAVDGWSFTWGSGRVNAAVGTTVTVHTEPVPVELAGRTCTLDGATNGTESVHPGNVLRVSFNGTPVDVLDVESAPNVEHVFSGTGTLNTAIVFAVVLGDGDASPNFQTTSITGTATVTCLPPPTTSTSTTVPSSSTSPPGTSSTTSPPSPSTVPSSSTVPTTTPPTVTTTPPPPPDTATTLPPAVSTTPTCRPGSYEIGRDDNGRPICAAVEESG